MKKVTIDLLSLSELSKSSKRKAVQSHKEFLLDVFNPDDYSDCGELTYSEYKKGLLLSEVIDNIEINEYLFFSNGELAPVTHYCGTHPQSGKTVLTLCKQEYTIKD